MEEVKIWFRSLPKFTRTYLVAVFLVTFTITYKLINPAYIILNFDKKLQIWRYFSNFLIAGKFSFSFLFFMILSNQTLTHFEKKAVQNKRYAEFIMMIFYISLILIIIAYLLDHTYYLSFELLFSLIYVECKRNPEQLKSVWGLVVRNAYVPWVMTVISLMTGGNVLDDLVGISAGFCYYTLKDYLTIKYDFDLLKTPEFLVSYMDNKKKPMINFTKLNNTPRENIPEALPQMPDYVSSFRSDGNSTGNLYNPSNQNSDPSWDG